MSKIEKMLQCNDCKEKLDELCQALGYNDAEREIAAEVLLWLEIGKLKRRNVNMGKIADSVLNASPPDATRPSVMWKDGYSMDITSPDQIKC